MASNGVPPARTSEGAFKDLLPCYYGSIGPLYLTHFQDSGNVQDLARYKPPHSDDQSIEPMGRAPGITTGEMVFFTGIDKDLYPGRYIDVRKMIVEELDPQVFVHPVEGQIYGYFSRFDPSHTSEERNGCRVQFTFERVATSATILTTEVVRDALSTATISAAAADVGIKDLGIVQPAQVERGTFTQQVDTWKTFLNEGGKDLSVNEITGALNEFRASIDSVIQAKELLDPRNYEVYRALRSLSASITEAAEQAASNAITLIEFSLDAESSPQELALQYYKDVARADEIAALNPPRFFFYPRHSILRIPDR